MTRVTSPTAPVFFPGRAAAAASSHTRAAVPATMSVTWQLHSRANMVAGTFPRLPRDAAGSGQGGGNRGSRRAWRNSAMQRCRRTFSQKVRVTSKSGTVPPSHSDGRLEAATPGAPPGRHGAGTDAGEARSPLHAQRGRTRRVPRKAASPSAPPQRRRQKERESRRPPSANHSSRCPLPGCPTSRVSATPPGCPAAGSQPPGTRSHRTAPGRAAPPGPVTHTAPPWWTCCRRGGPKRLPQQRGRRNAPARHRAGDGAAAAGMRAGSGGSGRGRGGNGASS